MMALLAVKYLVRGSGGPLIGAAALQAGLVGWVAWYLVEASWSAAALSASRTPLPPMVFQGAWITSLVTLVVAAPFTGARMGKGGWVGPDPTTALPIRAGTRLLSAWAAAVTLLGAIALAPLPIYFALFEMGAVGPAEVLAPLFTQLTVTILGPLPSVAITSTRHTIAFA